MLGYEISVFTLPGDYGKSDDAARAFAVDLADESRRADSPVLTRPRQGYCAAQWRSTSFGLNWLDDLVSQGFAERVLGDGYPSLYLVRGRQCVAAVTQDGGPPHEMDKRAVDSSGLQGVREDEWLLVQAWDLS